MTADDKVLTPETSLRAASETKTYVYNLPVDKDGITVKVSGLKLNSYEVTVSGLTVVRYLLFRQVRLLMGIKSS